MAYFYVKTGGTATGDQGRYASPLAGSWAIAFGGDTTKYYGTIYDVISTATTDAVGGDTVIVSSAHYEDLGAGGNTTFGNAGENVGGNYYTKNGHILYISVDDDNTEAYLPGATVRADAGSNSQVYVRAGCLLQGFVIDISYVLVAPASSFRDGSGRFVDCTITTGYIQVSGSGDDQTGVFVNTTIDFPATHGFGGSEGKLMTQNYGYLAAEGCTVTGVEHTASPVNRYGGLFGVSGAAGMLRAEFCDFSGFILTDGIVNTYSADATQKGSLEVNNCKLPAYTQLFQDGGGTYDSDFPSPFVFIEMSGCLQSGETLADFYGLYNSDYEIEADRLTYVDGEHAWAPNGTPVSFKVTTTANTSRANPCVFYLPRQYVDMGSSTQNTLVVHLTTDTALTDTDVWCAIVYRDSIVAGQINLQTSNPADSGNGMMAADPIAAGTALPTTTGKWIGGKTWTYQMTLDCSGDPGLRQTVEVRVELRVPSITVWFGAEYEVS